VIVQPDIPVILASASPRRKELLTKLGLKFDVIPAHIDESMRVGETALEHVRRLSYEKGLAIAQEHPNSVVISSDTVVVLNHEILGKPKDGEHAYHILRSLSGKVHEVITAFSIHCIDRNIILTDHEITEVHFRELSDKDIYDYIAGGSPMDKAGAYGIQDVEYYLVDYIRGSYHNVIGFPVAHFAMAWNKMVISDK